MSLYYIYNNLFYPWWKDWRGDWADQVEQTDAPPFSDQNLAEIVEVAKPTVDTSSHWE